MASIYTVDASVFLNAFNPHEAGQETSQRLLARFQEKSVPLIVPTLVLPEVSAAISRGRGDAGLARQFALALGRLPHLVWVPVDLARQASETAAQPLLGGADAIYVAVALRFGSTLITLDREQWQRTAGIVPVCSPTEALAAWGGR